MLDTLVELVTRGRCIPVHLSSLPRLEALVAEVQAWKEGAANTFLMENSPYSLLEVSSGRRTPSFPTGTTAPLCRRSWLFGGAGSSFRASSDTTATRLWASRGGAGCRGRAFLLEVPRREMGLPTCRQGAAPAASGGLLTLVP